jgi:hypothetical protein
MKKDSRTYSQRREYLIAAVSKRRKILREKSITLKGGRCEICGYGKCNEALEFHHLNGNEKDFGISARGYTRSWERVKLELEKCMLVCANCHREIHASLAAVPSNRD